MSEAFAWPLLANAQASLAETREQARAAGFDTGLKEGRLAAAAEVEEIRVALKASLQALPAVAAMLDAQQLRDVTEMILMLTRALIGVEVRTNSGIVARLVEEAFTAIGNSRAELVLRVSAEDAAWLETPDGFSIEVESSRRQGALTVVGQDLEFEFDPFARLAQLQEAMHESGTSARNADQ